MEIMIGKGKLSLNSDGKTSFVTIELPFKSFTVGIRIKYMPESNTGNVLWVGMDVTEAHIAAAERLQT